MRIALLIIVCGLSTQVWAQKESERRLAACFESMDYARISQDYVIDLFTEKEVERLKRRVNEFNTKLNLLEKRTVIVRKSSMPLSKLSPDIRSFFRSMDKDDSGAIEADEVPENLKGFPAKRPVSKSQFYNWRLGDVMSETDAEKVAKIAADLVEYESMRQKLYEDYRDALRLKSRGRGFTIGVPSFYKIEEVAREFVRFRSSDRERIVPYASMKELRMKVRPKK